MNYAVYFIAVGESALHCLSYAYRTLRQAGFEAIANVRTLIDSYIQIDNYSYSFVASLIKNFILYYTLSVKDFMCRQNI